MRFSFKYNCELQTCESVDSDDSDDGGCAASDELSIFVEPEGLALNQLVQIKEISLLCRFSHNSTTLYSNPRDPIWERVSIGELDPEDFTGRQSNAFLCCCANLGRTDFWYGGSATRDIRNNKAVESLCGFLLKLQEAGFCSSAAQLLVDSMNDAEPQVKSLVLREFKLYNGADLAVKRFIKSVELLTDRWKRRCSTLMLFDLLSDKRKANTILKAFHESDSRALTLVCNDIKSKGAMSSILACELEAGARLVDSLWALEYGRGVSASPADKECMSILIKKCFELEINPIREFALKGGIDSELQDYVPSLELGA